MPAHTLLPFLKWAGGKRWLSESLGRFIPDCSGVYFEPFLGSAAVFLRHLPARAELSDTNAELIECYKAIRDEHDKVELELNVLAERPPSASYYDIRRESPGTPAARAARFLYLNRTCWNGLYRVNLQGEFNVPRGTKSRIKLATDDFLRVSIALKSARLRVIDFEHALAEAGSGDVIFADPPYTVAHNTNGFVKYNQTIFSWDDQVRLANVLAVAADRGAIIIATNADHPDVRSLYDQNFQTRALTRASVIAAASKDRRKTTELLISNVRWEGW